MKALLIKLSFLAAVTGFFVGAAGIEGGASLTACSIGMAVCLLWMFLVMYANGR